MEEEGCGRHLWMGARDGPRLWTSDPRVDAPIVAVLPVDGVQAWVPVPPVS